MAVQYDLVLCYVAENEIMKNAFLNECLYSYAPVGVCCKSVLYTAFLFISKLFIK